MRQRPRRLYKKKNAPLRGANPIKYLGTYQDSYSISLFLEQWLLVNSRRFVACLSFIEFSPWSGVYSGSRAPPRYPFFRENRVVLPVKCIKWFKYKFGIIHTQIAPLRRASIIVSIFAAKRRFFALFLDLEPNALWLPPPRNLVPDALRANPLHKPTDWIRPCSYEFLNTRFLSLLFCFCQISKQKPKSEKFFGRYRRKVAPHKRNGWIRPCVYVVLIRAWRRPWWQVLDEFFVLDES